MYCLESIKTGSDEINKVVYFWIFVFKHIKYVVKNHNSTFKKKKNTSLLLY